MRSMEFPVNKTEPGFSVIKIMLACSVPLLLIIKEASFQVPVANFKVSPGFNSIFSLLNSLTSCARYWVALYGKHNRFDHNYIGGFLATEHLITQGCKRIAFLGGPQNLSISNKRKEGYLAAIKKYNIRRDNSLIIHCEFNQAYAQVATEELLRQKKKPDGIFAISDRIAIGASIAIKEKGLKMPDDISLIGFNNEPITKLLFPTISSIDQPAFEMGRAAAKIFVELMNAHEKTNDTIINLKPSLVIRQSSQKIKQIAKR